MSKSKGAVLTVSVLQEKGYDPLVYRFFCLQSHYRKPLEFSFDALDNANTAYQKLKKRCLDIKAEAAKALGGDASKAAANIPGDEKAAYEKFIEDFKAALENDINTSMATTLCYDVLKAEISPVTKLALIESFDTVLGLDLTVEKEEAAPAVDAELEKYITEQIELRKAAKKEKNFAEADRIRAELLQKGVALEDTREGVKWHLV